MALKTLAALPLDTIREPEAIEEHLRRLESAGDSDPPLTISSAKALVEATCKHVLEELKQAYDEAADLPALVKAVKKALKVHPDTIAPTAKGRETIVRTLVEPVAGRGGTRRAAERIRPRPRPPFPRGRAVRE